MISGETMGRCLYKRDDKSNDMIKWMCNIFKSSICVCERREPTDIRCIGHKSHHTPMADFDGDRCEKNEPMNKRPNDV